MTARRLLSRIALLAVLSAFPGAALASPVVDLAIIGPDRAIDTRFGHVLLLVRDPDTGRDDAYDFGVGDFHRVDFAVETALGRGLFRLRRSPAKVRLGDYRSQDRRVELLRLALTSEQLRDLDARLARNLEPDRVRYVYDHVLDNCSTRLRDHLDAVTDGALRVAAPGLDTPRSFRDEILAAGSGRLAALVGLDLFAGERGEDRAGAWERAFLPERLGVLVRGATNPATGEPLVAFTQLAQERAAPPAVGGSTSIGRRLVVAVGLVVGLLLAATRSSRSRWLGRAAGVALFVFALGSGVAGAALLPIRVLSTGTIWTVNANAWLFWPTDWLWLGPALRWTRSGEPCLGRLARLYTDARLGVLALLGLGKVVGMSPQDNTAFLAAVACVLVGLRLVPGAPR